MAKKEYTNRKMLEIICSQIYKLDSLSSYTNEELIGLIALYVGNITRVESAEFRKLLKHVNKMDIKLEHLYDLYAEYVDSCNKWKEHIDFVANNGDTDKFLNLQSNFRSLTNYLITDIEKLDVEDRCVRCGILLKDGTEVAGGRIRTQGTKIHICDDCFKHHIKDLNEALKDKKCADRTKDAVASYIAQHIKY